MSKSHVKRLIKQNGVSLIKQRNGKITKVRITEDNLPIDFDIKKGDFLQVGKKYFIKII